MISNLKTIDQQGIKSLLRERLEHPELYTNKPLIVWRSEINDGIQTRILHHAVEDYNNGRDAESVKWYHMACADFGEYDITNNSRINPNNGRKGGELEHSVYKIGLLAFHTMPWWSKEKFDKFRTLINTRKWGDIEMLPDVPIVAYLHGEKYGTPEDYPTAEQYMFEPDFEEWAEWTLADKPLSAPIVDFIRGDGDKDGVTYRWYGCVKDLKGDDIPYPKIKWGEVINSLSNEIKFEEIKANSLSDLADDDIKFAMKGKMIPEAVAEDFIKYLRSK